MGAADRRRLRVFLEIAAQSPFPGERANALAAAKRLAGRHGLSLREAVRGPEAAPDPRPRETARRYTAREMADIINLSEARLRADKERYERALREAVSRGLDRNDAAPGERNGAKGHARPRRNPRRRHSNSYARVLLNETSLPLGEIVTLTGLDIYKIAGMKLKMRPLA